MAENYISVIVNYKNLRCMTLVKENCYISDLIKEVENTLAKLCSLKVKIKTLKNSVNAVLPDWYPVAPLLRNRDEIFAFTDSAVDVLNIDFTKNINCCENDANQVHNTVSPFGSCVMADSGFTSPLMKLGVSEERDRTLEITGMDVDQLGRQENQNVSGQDLSQDEGNDLSSEKLITFKDHKQREIKQSNVQLGNLDAKISARAQVTKMPDKNNTEKEGTAELDDESSSEISDENSRKSNESVAKKVKSKTTNKACESTNSSLETNSKEKAQTNESSQKLTIKRKNASLTTTSVRTNLCATTDNSDSSDDSTASERMDVDGKHDNRKVLSSRSKTTISVKNMNKNKEVDSKSTAKPQHQESESSHNSSESENVTVDSRNKVQKISTKGIVPKKLDSGKVDFTDVFAKKRNHSDQNKSMADSSVRKDTNEDRENSTKSVSEQIYKPTIEDKAGKTTKKATTEKGERVDNSERSSSDDSSSDSDENEATRKTKQTNQRDSSKQNANKSTTDINVKDMTIPKDTTKQTNAIKLSKDVKSDSSSSSDSSWSSSEDEDKPAKTKGSNNENATGKRSNKKESQTDAVDDDKGESSRSGNPATPATKLSSTNENNVTKGKAKGKDAVVNNGRENETNLDPASPAKSVRSKKGKEMSSKSNQATKGTAGNKISSKSKSNDTEAQEKSDDESSVSTLKAPFTQLPAKGKPKVHAGDEDHAGNEKVKDKEMVNDGKKKVQNNAADKKTDHDAATPADQTQRNESPWLPQTPPSSKYRKSSVLSAKKVASWLLSNPVSENEEDETRIGTETPQNSRTRSKNKNDPNKLVQEAAIEPHLTKFQNKTMNDANVDQVADNVINSNETPATPSRKRKLDKGSKQEHPMKPKKNKKKKSEKTTGEEQRLNEEPLDKQNKASTKTRVSTKTVKNTTLSLPKISKGLLALIEDESDNPRKSGKKSEKQRHAPPTINRRLEQRGFLTTSNIVERMGAASKIPKSRIKKISSCQQRKTVEMNEKEQEFLESSALDLETLLNDETVKW